MIEPWDGEEDLLPLATSWMNEAVPGSYNIHKGLKDLRGMHEGEFSDVLILRDWDGTLVGAMGIEMLDMFFSDKSYAAVRYWYILPKFRWMARSFIKGAKKWADRHGCDVLLVCSNSLCAPSDEFWKKMHFRYFETVYAGDI